MDTSFTQNRELSWLDFNERVLEEANDENVRLFERLKFFSIFGSNLEEFFMVRVGSLTDLSHLKKKAVDNKSGMTPEEQLSAIMKR
ncbi:MAG: RNA degradosome polyphosphate kinase, partial [Anaerococcus sp.]|nr:RNA degradosome polyphosphate kinase [Peptoniphilaceae bacterium]MDY3056000.1 RNA degradosome polyphosphate kinase [Anaerococcus sp.]